MITIRNLKGAPAEMLIETRYQHSILAVICFCIGCAASLGATEIAVPQPSGVMTAPDRPDEKNVPPSDRNPREESPELGGCWGICKENMFLALSATDPNITREMVVNMGGYDGFGSFVPGKTRNPQFRLDFSDPQWAVSPATLKDLMGVLEKPRLIDARSPAENDGRSLFGAFPLQLPLASDTLQAVLPDKNQMVVVFGKDVMTVSVKHLSAELRRLGYSNVLELQEGLDGWVAKNGEHMVIRAPETSE